MRRVERWHDGVATRIDDAIAEEVPVALAFDGVDFAVMMATPADLEDFARGFALTEGLVPRVDAIVGVSVAAQLDGVVVDVQLAPGTPAPKPPQRALEGRSGCGICGSRRLEDVLRLPPPVRGGPTIAAAVLDAALAAMAQRQSLNAATGATHAAAWCDAHGNVVLLREDVGRHNALDKLIGALASAGFAAADGFVVVTSRASYEMALKAARAGIAFVAAVSAPTALAIALADSVGLTLIGFARPQGCAVYTHAHRYAAVRESA